MKRIKLVQARLFNPYAMYTEIGQMYVIISRNKLRSKCEKTALVYIQSVFIVDLYRPMILAHARGAQ